MKITGQIVNETDVILYFRTEINAELIRQVITVQNGLLEAFSHSLIDTVPSYGSMLLCFHPQDQQHPVQRFDDILQMANVLIETLPVESLAAAAPIRLPVYYGEEAGADFAWACQQTGLTAEQFIEAHSTTTYHVYALGFSPGFGFLGQLPSPLQLPRKAQPRKQVPAGSVAIAHDQTAIYPATTPGGWHLIGRCPTQLFNPQKQPAALLQVGNAVMFEPISRQQYLDLGGKL